MSQQTWREIVVNQTGAGTLFNTYTTAKSVINPQALWTVPSGYWFPGRRIWVHVSGGISNRVTGPDTTTFQVMHGTIAVWTSGAINLTTTAHTVIPFWLDIELTCRAVGSGTSANLMGQGLGQGQMLAMVASAADNAAGTGWAMMPNTAPAVGTGFDSTVANIFDFWVAQSVSNAGNGIQIQQYAVSIEN